MASPASLKHFSSGLLKFFLSSNDLATAEVSSPLGDLSSTPRYVCEQVQGFKCGRHDEYMTVRYGVLFFEKKQLCFFF